MSKTCTDNCNSCNEDCGDRSQQPVDFSAQPHPLSHVNKVIGVVSGKGGVGKSLVTSLLATMMQRKGYRAGILDADVTGPSIPKSFGITAKASGNNEGLFPIESSTGIPIMSINLLLPNDTDPVVWRGPIIAGTVKQFWTDVVWGYVDYLFVDMPPGTGDVPLTVFQSLPVDGIVIVSSPQELVSMIVEKAVKMADMMNIPILGMVENMSYFTCPDCGAKFHPFGESHIEEIAAKHNIPVYEQLPIDPRIATACDHGKVEELEGDWLGSVVEMLEQLEGKE